MYIYVLIQRRNSLTNDHGTDVISSKPHYLNRRSDRGFKVPDEKQTRQYVPFVTEGKTESLWNKSNIR